MKLSETEISLIKTEILNLDEDAKIYLYGLNTDETLINEDINLLVISRIINTTMKNKIKSILFKNNIRNKIDIILSKDGGEPFALLALKNSIKL